MAFKGGWGGGKGWEGGYGGPGPMSYGMGGYGMDGYGMGGYGKGFDMKGFGKGFGKCEKDAKGLVRGLLQSGALPASKWDNDDNALFVSGLPPDMTDLEMYTIFASFGRIAPRGASARTDKETGKCTGIGFVNYLDGDAAHEAIKNLNGYPLPDGTWLTVKKKGPPKEKGAGKGK
eukprot:gb/GFBE01029916.1/.p1 GENE.gb/GFBE01029916.1/~~gb/GFBE01029916.1/.p1  ORF type:complete len:175 (+),score=44.55 gb/GFBE01029916.1/:1-525(+)